MASRWQQGLEAEGRTPRRTVRPGTRWAIIAFWTVYLVMEVVIMFVIRHDDALGAVMALAAALGISAQVIGLRAARRAGD